MLDIVTSFFAILLASEKIYERLGGTGTLVIVKVFGLILGAIAVQFILNGIRAAFLTA